MRYTRGMSIDAEKLRDEALKLPAKDRAKLVADLLGSLEDLDDMGDHGHEEAWVVEIEERARQIEAGEVATVPWSEARRRIRAE